MAFGIQFTLPGENDGDPEVVINIPMAVPAEAEPLLGTSEQAARKIVLFYASKHGLVDKVDPDDETQRIPLTYIEKVTEASKILASIPVKTFLPEIGRSYDEQRDAALAAAYAAFSAGVGG